MFLNRNLLHGVHHLTSFHRHPLKTSLLFEIPSIITCMTLDGEDIRIMQKINNHDARPDKVIWLEPKQWMTLGGTGPAIDKIVNLFTRCMRPDFEDESRFVRGCRYGGTEHCTSHEDVLVAVDESNGEELFHLGGYYSLRGDRPYQWVCWYLNTDGPLSMYKKYPVVSIGSSTG